MNDNFLNLSCFSLVLLCMTTVWSPGAARAGDVEIVAHRGASHEAPENTLAAVNLAWAQSADGVEIDVYLSRDGRIVAHHDKTTKKTAGKDVAIVEQTFDELRALDVGRWKNAKYRGERIPTLVEILATIPQGKRLFIEVKCGPEIVPQLKADLRKAGKSAEQTAVIGFSLEAMRAVKDALPELQVYLVSGLKKNKVTRQWSPKIEDLVKQAKDARLDGLDLQSCGALTRASVQKIREADLGFYVWTVDDPQEARRVIELGVDGITTNRPGWLREQVVSAASR